MVYPPAGALSLIYPSLDLVLFPFSFLAEVASFHGQSDEAHFLNFCLDFAPPSCSVCSVLGYKISGLIGVNFEK